MVGPLLDSLCTGHSVSCQVRDPSVLNVLACCAIVLVRLLTPMERREGEEVSELCDRVQDSLREELKLRKSEVTLDDIKTWLEGQE